MEVNRSRICNVAVSTPKEGQVSFLVCPHLNSQGKVQLRSSTHSRPPSCGPESDVTVYEMAVYAVALGMVGEVPRKEGSWLGIGD